MQKIIYRSIPLAMLAALTLAGCGGGGSGSGSVIGTHGQFVVLRTDPPNNGTLFLNEAIGIEFSSNVDLKPADLNSVSFAVFDLNGTPLSEQPAGSFRLAAASGDDTVGRRLEFLPRFPTNDTFDDGGFKPGRRYVVQLVGGDVHNGTVLKDTRGKALAVPVSFQFATVDGTSPAQLFKNTKPGGPHKVGFEITPLASSTGVGLNKLGLDQIELRLKFDQPLNPASTNVPVHVETDPARRDPGKRGRIFLEYDDPSPGGRSSWIPASVDLDVNTLDGSEVVLRPIGVLPNNATLRVVVQNTLEDMSGESNVADVSFNPVFAEFKTQTSYAPQFDALVENFDDTSHLDLTAAFLEPLASVKPGFLQASFSFEGSQTFLTYEPTVPEVILNTDFTQITPKGAPPFNVAGGVFQFDSVHIPKGVTVRGVGSRPMVWLVTGDFIVDGTLSVDGGPGARVDTLNSANYPTGGGIGVCGGGNGGLGSPSVTGTSLKGQDGFGPGQVPHGGGGGGLISCTKAGCNQGSGGGGGSFTTKGDPDYPLKSGANNLFKQVEGQGGWGCGNRTLDGGLPGAIAFTDARNDNNFWGAGVDVFRQIRVTGELGAPRGGAGGGGGGDQSGLCVNNQNWASDSKGGGGGGGGGILIIKVLGDFQITATGLVTANGGHGGGGEQAGTSSLGGGGGGGSGGMLVVMAGHKIQLVVKGSAPYSALDPNNGSYSFCMSADGGVGLRGSFSGGGEIFGKYPSVGGGGTTTPSSWDSTPGGGMGGLGLLQLMAPPGNDFNNQSDQTNTVLDDNIELYTALNQPPLTGLTKMKLLAWQGWQGKDDSGKAIDAAVLGKEGDIRPTPILLPAPYGPRSRMRSSWIDTGLAVRRPLDPKQFGSGTGDGQARGIVEQGNAMGDLFLNLVQGPNYLFAATNDASKTSPGYVRYLQKQTGVDIDFPAILPSPAPVLLPIDANSTFEGRPAYKVELAAAQPKLVEVAPGRYAHFRAELLNDQGSTLGEFRILDHTDRVFMLSPDAGAIPAGVTKLQVRGKFFSLVTNTAPGLGPTHSENGLNVPDANVRIGFAFHTNPGDPNGKRYPPTPGEFVYGLDFQNPSVMQTIRSQLLTGSGPYGGPRFVQWDVLFNGRFSEAAGNNSEKTLTPDIALPELHYLVLPFQF